MPGSVSRIQSRALPPFFGFDWPQEEILDRRLQVYDTNVLTLVKIHKSKWTGNRKSIKTLEIILICKVHTPLMIFFIALCTVIIFTSIAFGAICVETIFLVTLQGSFFNYTAERILKYLSILLTLLGYFVTAHKFYEYIFATFPVGGNIYLHSTTDRPNSRQYSQHFSVVNLMSRRDLLIVPKRSPLCHHRINRMRDQDSTGLFKFWRNIDKYSKIILVLGHLLNMPPS